MANLQQVVVILTTGKSLKSDLQSMNPAAAFYPRRWSSILYRAEFAGWHVASLMLNFVTLALVTAGMAMTTKLPDAS